jgi:hypothetical protein
MLEWLSQQQAGPVIGLLAVSGGILVATIAIITSGWARVRRAELRAHLAEAELALKQQMIEKGMSAEEIVQVLAAGQPKPTEEHVLAQERSPS